MNTLLKGMIIALAAVFGFGLVAAGVSIAVTPDEASPVTPDNVAVKRDDDAAGPVSVVDDDDDADPDDTRQTRTRTRTGHGDAQVRADDDTAAGDTGQTRTRTRTGHGDGAGDRDDDNSGHGSGGDHSRDLSRDLTDTR